MDTTMDQFEISNSPQISEFIFSIVKSSSVYNAKNIVIPIFTKWSLPIRPDIDSLVNYIDYLLK